MSDDMSHDVSHEELRSLPIPVIGRVSDGALWLDLRCLDDETAFLRLFETDAAP